MVSIGLRAVCAGVLVAAFAGLGELFAPKRFAGIFAGAPSVAIANLAILAALQGRSEAQVASSGMVIGGIAFVIGAAACSVLAVVAATIAWLVASVAAYAVHEAVHPQDASQR